MVVTIMRTLAKVMVSVAVIVKMVEAMVMLCGGGEGDFFVVIKIIIL